MESHHTAPIINVSIIELLFQETDHCYRKIILFAYEMLEGDFYLET